MLVDRAGALVAAFRQNTSVVRGPQNEHEDLQLLMNQLIQQLTSEFGIAGR